MASPPTSTAHRLGGLGRRYFPFILRVDCLRGPIMEQQKPIRLLIADDHEVVRSGLKSLVAGTEIEVIGEAGTADESVRLAEELRPDVVLLDIRMPDNDGLNALSRIKLS